jgi:TonB family protein
MFLDRLESGFLLFETQQGLVRAELTFRQRIYLLWTFRHFRQLSMLLLNPRQRALVNSLYHNNVGVVTDLDDSWPVIGTIESFVPPTLQINVAPTPEEKRLPEPSIQIEPSFTSAPSSLPRFAWSRIAATAGALFFCLVFVAAWHRDHGIVSAQAHNRPQLQQVSATSEAELAQPAKPAMIVETPAAITPVESSTDQLPAPKAEAKRASVAVVAPTPERAIRVHDAISTSNATRSIQDDGIQATRSPLRVVYPVYPNTRIRGEVALTARVDSDGIVRNVTVLSGNRALATAAVRAVRQWRYRPYLKDGQPVATETNVVISFIAEDAISMSFPPSISAAR